MSTAKTLQEKPLLRIWDIVGSKKKKIPALIPISRTTFLNGIKEGKYPAGKKIGKRIRVWSAPSIQKLITELGGNTE